MSTQQDDDDQQDAVSKLKDPQIQPALKEIFKQISEELDTQEAARDQINEILAAAEAKFGVKKSVIRKAARMYHKRDAAKFTAETSAVKDLYDIVTA